MSRILVVFQPDFHFTCYTIDSSDFWLFRGQNRTIWMCEYVCASNCLSIGQPVRASSIFVHECEWVRALVCDSSVSPYDICVHACAYVRALCLHEIYNMGDFSYSNFFDNYNWVQNMWMHVHLHTIMCVNVRVRENIHTCAYMNVVTFILFLFFFTFSLLFHFVLSMNVNAHAHTRVTTY